MARRRNRKRNQNSQTGGSNQNPFDLIEADSDKQQKFGMFEVAESVRKLFSNGSIVWFAVVVLIGAVAINWTFYWGMAQGRFELSPVVAALVAAAITIGTTIYQCYPVATGNGQSALEDVFKALARPKSSEMRQLAQGDHHASTRVHDYSQASDRQRKRMMRRRNIAMGFELILGLSVLATSEIMDGGWTALFVLGLFVFSIFGAEWAVDEIASMSDRLLPQEAQEAMDRTIKKARFRLTQVGR